MHDLILKAATLVAVSVALVVGGMTNAAAAEVRTEAQPASVSCVNSAPSGYSPNAKFSNPNACRKCQDRGADYERGGNFKAHCQKLYNPAGTLTGAQLWLLCVVCRNEQ